MLNWYFTYKNPDNQKQEYGDIITPALPNLKFVDVKDQIIIPFIKTIGVTNPVGLTYARAKNAPADTLKVNASDIAPFIEINNVKFSTKDEVYYEGENISVENINAGNKDLIVSHSQSSNLDKVKDLEQLLSLWKKEHINDIEYNQNSNPAIESSSFVEDGMICPKEYHRAKIKILFILKEANVVYDQKLGENGKFTAFRSSIEWINGVINQGTRHELIETMKGMNSAIYEAIERNEGNLKNIAYMNLNKRGGGGKSITKILKAYVSKYKDYIRKEIELLNPGYVVCCGSGCFEYISKIVYGITETNSFFNDKTFFIKARHPSYSYMSTQDKVNEFREQFKFIYLNMTDTS